MDGTDPSQHAMEPRRAQRRVERGAGLADNLPNEPARGNERKHGTRPPGVSLVRTRGVRPDVGALPLLPEAADGRARGRDGEDPPTGRIRSGSRPDEALAKPTRGADGSCDPGGDRCRCGLRGALRDRHAVADGILRQGHGVEAV